MLRFTQRGEWKRNKKKTGAPGEIRTPDLQLRRLPLYPAELRARGPLSLQASAITINITTGPTARRLFFRQQA